MIGVKFVPVEADEIPFVVDAWVRSFRDSPWAGCISNDRYQEVMRERVNDLLARGVRVVVAVPEEGKRRVFGFIATEAPDIIHYVYVKKSVRKLGLASRLVAECAATSGRFTFRTPASDFLFRRNYTWTPVPARVTIWNNHASQ